MKAVWVMAPPEVSSDLFNSKIYIALKYVFIHQLQNLHYTEICIYYLPRRRRPGTGDIATPPVRLSVCLSVRLSVHLSVRLSVCLSVRHV